MHVHQSIRSVRQHYRDCLKGIYELSEIDSIFQIVSESVLGISGTNLLINANDELAQKDWKKYESVLERLKKNEPVQYILGQSEFYGLTFWVNQHTLIPRQETELLVDFIIKEHRDKKIRLLDIGTGSGCIAISLQKNLPLAEVYALDISESAIEVAKENATRNNTSVIFEKHNILDGGSNATFDLIVSNPPYVKNEEKKLMKENVLGFEPHLALFVSDNNALVFYKAIATYASRHLHTGGQVWVEINEVLGKETEEVFRMAGFENTVIINDLNGKNRFVKAW